MNRTNEKESNATFLLRILFALPRERKKDKEKEFKIEVDGRRERKKERKKQAVRESSGK